MASKEYTIYGKNDKKVILNADCFDPKKHTKIVQITPEMEKKQDGNTQYTAFINNTIANNKNNYNKGVYIKFKPIRLARNPIFKFNAATMGKFYTGEDDVKRYNLLISINPDDEGCKQLEKVFVSIDTYYNGKDFGKYMFTENTKIISNGDSIFKPYKLFTTAAQNQKKKSAEKNPYKDMGSIKIKLDLDKTNTICTIFAKKDGDKMIPFTINKFDDLCDYIGRGAVIQPIIRLKKVYCSKGEQDEDKTLYKCGITAVFEQIIILESGSTSAGVVHEFINDDGYSIAEQGDSTIAINPTIPKNKAKDVLDEPQDGELDSDEQISENEQSEDSITIENDDDNEEEADDAEDNAEEEAEENNEEIMEEEEVEEEKPAPKPAEKKIVKKTITKKTKK